LVERARPDFLTQEFGRTGFQVGWHDIATWTKIDSHALLEWREAATACLVYWGRFDVAVMMNRDIINQLKLPPNVQNRYCPIQDIGFSRSVPRSQSIADWFLA